MKMIVTSASKPGRRAAQDEAQQFGFDHAVGDARAEERERIGQKQQHEDDDDVGQVDQEQPDQRVFLTRTEQHRKRENADGGRQHGDLQIAHAAARVARQAAGARALHVDEGDARRDHEEGDVDREDGPGAQADVDARCRNRSDRRCSGVISTLVKAAVSRKTALIR